MDLWGSWWRRIKETDRTGVEGGVFEAKNEGGCGELKGRMNGSGRDEQSKAV